jgi:S1-C subfamily serine protease
VTAGGQPVRSVDDLSGALRAAASAGTIELTVLRGTEERTIQVVLGSGDQAEGQS